MSAPTPHLPLDDALRLAQAYLDERFDRSDEIVVDRQHTWRDDLGWVVPYDRRQALATGDPLEMLVENGPLLVEDDGSITALPTVRPSEYWLELIRFLRATDGPEPPLEGGA